MKRELDSLVKLQADSAKVLTSIDGHLSDVLDDGESSELARLTQEHRTLIGRIEESYAKLRIENDEQFQSLKGYPLELVRMILCARDMKKIVRTRATASFLERSRLYRAAGGAHAALGHSSNSRS